LTSSELFTFYKQQMLSEQAVSDGVQGKGYNLDKESSGSQARVTRAHKRKDQGICGM